MTEREQESPISELPVAAVLGDLKAALAASGRAVLVAPPGAGKTTLVPLALLDAPWRGDGRLIVLEPRRLAARAAAARMADMLGEPVGKTVGLITRGETKTSAATRIQVVTEGVLTRMLLDDPSLDGVAGILFDEFHERSLQADLGLALALETADALRDDLRLIVMSATLKADPIAAHLAAPVIESRGRQFPVDIRYRAEDPRTADLIPRMTDAILDLTAEEPGSLLAFLPGEREIRAVAERLTDALGRTKPDPPTDIHPLYGALPKSVQDAAIRPPPPGTRKIVLATDIAETSLTIDGVRLVVDGGFRRAPVVDPGSGLPRLTTVRIARSAADQRAGRAGRTEPGIALRLWPEAAGGAMAPFDPPEIETADLARLRLDVARWGAPRADALPWLTPPPPAGIAAAETLLTALGALDAAGRLTDRGKAMAALPTHPRLAAMLIAARHEGPAAAWTACRLAATLEARDPLKRGDGPATADMADRIALFHRNRAPKPLVEDADRLARALGLKPARPGGGAPHPQELGRWLAHAYPDRIAKQRGRDGRLIMTGGKGAVLPPNDPLLAAEWLVVADVKGGGAEPRVMLAAPIDPEDLPRDRFRHEDRIAWDKRRGAVLAERIVRLGAIPVSTSPLTDADPNEIAEALLSGIAADGGAKLPWGPEASRLRARLAFLHRLDPERFPSVADEALAAALSDWLGPFVAGVMRRDAITDAMLCEGLLTHLGWENRDALDRLAPERLSVPSGNRHRVDYEGDPPVLAVKLQELFGLAETPKVGGVPVTVHLLSPAGRPLQVTQDLAGFWQTGYREVAKEMRGRYPKHPWPDDPLTAPATARTKRA